MMQLVGCNHRTCPLPLRERLAFSPPAIPAFLRQFQRRFPRSEVVLLSTCNRLELYTSAVPRVAVPSREQALAFLAEYKGIPIAELDDAFYVRQWDQAVRHLFEVASSLDSMILGESQIIGQVRRAFQIADRRQCTGVHTRVAFSAAVRTARRIARETMLFRHRVSIPRLAVSECARPVFDQLGETRIVVVGAGTTATETLRALRDEGARTIVILNHHDEKARKLADQFRAQTRPWHELPQAFAQADLVITATGAATPLVSVERYRRWLKSSTRRTLLIFDFGVPRDVDHRVGDEPGIVLYSIDDLRGLAERNRQRRSKEVPRALEIIEEETSQFTDRQLREAIAARA